MEIDLAIFKKRSEFIEAYESLEQERNYWQEFCHELQVKLQEYEGVEPTQEEAEKEFQKFWSAYGRVGNVKMARKRWFSLSKKKKALAMAYVPAYVKATPKGGYPSRKHGEGFISREVWNDQLPTPQNDKFGRPPAVRAQTSIIEDDQAEQARLKKHSELRQASRGRSVRDLIK